MTEDGMADNDDGRERRRGIRIGHALLTLFLGATAAAISIFSVVS